MATSDSVCAVTKAGEMVRGGVDMQKIDALGEMIAPMAAKTLLRVCPGVKNASLAELCEVSRAMRAKSKPALNEFFEACLKTPALTQVAVVTASLSIAGAGAEKYRQLTHTKP